MQEQGAGVSRCNPRLEPGPLLRSLLQLVELVEPERRRVGRDFGQEAREWSWYLRFLAYAVHVGAIFAILGG